MKRSLWGILAAACAMAIMVSCATTADVQGATPDEKALNRGIAAWNEKSPIYAKQHWDKIKDKTLREKYLQYVNNYETGSKALEQALAYKPEEEPRSYAAYDKARAAFSTFPETLKVPSKDKSRALPIAERHMRIQIDADNLNGARATGKAAAAVFGTTDAINAMNKEIDLVYASRANAAAAAAITETARNTADFDAKMAKYDEASAAYGRAESSLASEANKLGIAKNKSVSTEAAALKRARQGVAVEKEKLLREKAYAYKDMIGEEFARQPVGKKPGTVTPQELLTHLETVKANIERIASEMRAFGQRYPGAIDQDTLADFEAQKKDLEVKIAQIIQEIKTAEELASRGKMVMPLMIGLFNPQPGSTAESKKSRPALFSGTQDKKNEYWWGLVSIPRGVMNDLVVTLKDNRTVRVFPANTKSGTLIDRNKIPDLVNRSARLGNSWPVLNAGAQLSGDKDGTAKYFFELQPGRTADYSGEVVIYSAFITRVR